MTGEKAAAKTNPQAKRKIREIEFTHRYHPAERKSTNNPTADQAITPVE